MSASPSPTQEGIPPRPGRAQRFTLRLPPPTASPSSPAPPTPSPTPVKVSAFIAMFTFLAFPVELQSHILSFLPQQDLATVVRVSQHLQAVAIKLLYVKVKLRSWEHINAFFFPGSLPRPGFISADERTDAQGQHWDHIKTLSICAPTWDLPQADPPTFYPPGRFQGRGARRLDVDTLILRETDYQLVWSILPLLRCFNPRKLILWDATNLPALAKALPTLGWTRLQEFSATMDRGYGTGYDQAIPLEGITTVRIHVDFPDWTEEPGSGDDVVAVAVRLFPSAPKLRLVVPNQHRKTELDDALKDGLAGKSRDFFRVEVGTKA